MGNVKKKRGCDGVSERCITVTVLFCRGETGSQFAEEEFWLSISLCPHPHPWSQVSGFGPTVEFRHCSIKGKEWYDSMTSDFPQHCMGKGPYKWNMFFISSVLRSVIKVV